jgi:hypothetical protein
MTPGVTTNPTWFRQSFSARSTRAWGNVIAVPNSFSVSCRASSRGKDGWICWLPNRSGVSFECDRKLLDFTLRRL